MFGTPPYHARLVWTDKVGHSTSEVAIEGQNWPTVEDARKAMDEFLASRSMPGVEVHERPTEAMKAKGLSVGPIVRTAEIWDSHNTRISGYAARFRTEPEIPEAEAFLAPIVIGHFRQLDKEHGPWRIYLRFTPIDGGEALSLPLEKHGVPVRYARLADMMFTIIEMMKADFIPENGVVLTSGSHRAAAELPPGKFKFDAYARAEDGFENSFPDAPNVEDAMN